MGNGWIKIYRQLQDKGYYMDSHYIHLWVHILLRANHKGKEFFHGGKIIKLSRGQFVTGRKTLELETGINESKVERILKCYENEQQIKQETHSKYRIITILNYSKYQDIEQQSKQQTNNKRTASEQQVNTNKNDKNVRMKEKRDSVADATLYSFKEEVEKLNSSNRKDLKVISLYWSQKKWVFENKEQFNSSLKRELRPAKALIGYSGVEILSCMRFCQNEYGDMWTLETVGKRIPELINKNENR